MTASVHRFRSKRDCLREEAREKLRQLVLDFEATDDIQENIVGPLVSVIDNQMASKKGWTFVMIGPNENSAVVKWLSENSERPMAAMRLWAILFTGLRMDTGEIVISRDEIAKRVRIAPQHVSNIMGELENIGAISRVREGRGVRYFMNPNVGTCLKGRSRDEAQAQAVQLTLV